MAEILLCPSGSLALADVQALRKAGIVVVQTDNPAACKFVRSGEIVGAGDMLWAALDALNKGTYSGSEEQRNQLAKNLLKIVLDSRQRMATVPAAEAISTVA